MARLWGKQGRCGWPARSERPQPWPRPVEVQGSLEHDLALTDRLCSTCPHAGGRPLGFFFAAASGSSTLALLAEDFSPVSLSPLGGCLDHPPFAVPCQYIPLAPTKQPASASKLTAPDSLVAFGGRPRPAATIVLRLHSGCHEGAHDVCAWGAKRVTHRNSGTCEVLTSPMTTAELGVHHMSFCSPASPSQHPRHCFMLHVCCYLPHLPTFWFSSAMNAPPPGRFGSSCMAKGATRRWHRGALPERRPERRRRHRRRWQA